MCVRLTIRAGGEVISRKLADWDLLVALAVLSAEPESVAEYFAALRRYQPNHRCDQWAQDAAIQDSINADGPCCLIDVDSRSIFAGGEFELPQRRNGYQADEDECDDGFPIVWLDIPDDWLFEKANDRWMEILEERARSEASRPRVDTRSVLFGRPMLEFIANRVLVAARGDNGDENNDEGERRYSRIRAIHADWLMTPHDDLLGRTPREVLLRKHGQIELDIQHRSEQWSRQGSAPAALREDSAAYRYGGYGTTEIVIYFDLMRSLLGAAWDLAVEGTWRPDALVERLVSHRDEFLDQPPEDSASGLTCRELIDRERRRMPIASDGGHLDCDCPICQAEADGAFGSGPAFMFFDGHHLELEDEFAFSLIESREEWEEDQESFRSYTEAVGRKYLPPEAENQQAESVWTSSFVDWDSAVASGESPVSAKLAIGFLVAELVSLLKQRDAGRPPIDALNAAFTSFRRAADRIVENSAAEELRNCLEDVADAYPDLTSRSADLQSRLDEVLRASSQQASGS